MIELGYWLSSEEHTPRDLVAHAQRAEEVGFRFAHISDHFHPWVDRQGHSPFIWSVIGGIATVTKQLHLTTAVTCPIMRIHPAIIAQAAATAALMMPGRFALGVGTGEHLNEHILGDHWPPIETRQEMLAEAVEIIRLLWQGKNESYDGDYFVVEDARLYSVPEQLPPILVAASGSGSAELAGEIADGLISVAPSSGLVDAFREAGGEGKLCAAKLTFCYAEDAAEARRLATEMWPNAAMGGSYIAELRLPAYFEQVAKLVTEDAVAEAVICGPDPEPYVKAIQQYADAGFDQLSLHQIGPDQEGFFRFYQEKLAPALDGVVPQAGR